jgi:GNAT superfamily N-acetyltransferase
LIKNLSKEYEIDTNANRIDAVLVYRFLSGESYWAKDRSLAEVKKSIENSLNFGLYKKDAMIGFARIITDYVSFAYLADVFIVKEEQGKGLGKTLINYILDFPSIKNAKRWMLGTMDAHEMYRPYGFSEVANPKRWMERIVDKGF